MSAQTALMNWITNPERTMLELKNALTTHLSDPAILDCIENRLDERFPGWDDSRTLTNSQKPSIHVHFNNEHKAFLKARDAYVWLVEKMLPDNFDMCAIGVTQLFQYGTHGGCYAATNLDELFHGDTKRISDPKKWHKLPNGWFLNLNLSNDQKLERLIGLSAVVGHSYDEDWSWRIDGEVVSDLSEFDELIQLRGDDDSR